MMTKQEKLLFSLLAAPAIEVIPTLEQYADLRDKGAHLKKILSVAGFENVDVEPGVLLTDDGREVSTIGGQTFALRQEIHDARLNERLAAKAQDATANVIAPKKHTPGEGMSSVLCPRCQSIMAKQPICPNCHLGQQGFKILCLCTNDACEFEVPL
ncbi:hypothetical protein DSECCO2_500120 [anaerobic digester metagenome]